MKRLVATLALLGILGTSLPQAQAGDWYGGGYPPQEQYPILKKVLVGGALFGAGFLAGRLTAPKPQPYPAYPHPHGGYYPQQGGGHHGHHGWGRQINYQSGNFQPGNYQPGYYGR
jgi:hypothetical protein